MPGSVEQTVSSSGGMSSARGPRQGRNTESPRHGPQGPPQGAVAGATLEMLLLNAARKGGQMLGPRRRSAYAVAEVVGAAAEAISPKAKPASPKGQSAARRPNQPESPRRAGSRGEAQSLQLSAAGQSHSSSQLEHTAPEPALLVSPPAPTAAKAAPAPVSGLLKPLPSPVEAAPSPAASPRSQHAGYKFPSMPSGFPSAPTGLAPAPTGLFPEVDIEPPTPLPPPAPPGGGTTQEHKHTFDDDGFEKFPAETSESDEGDSVMDMLHGWVPGRAQQQQQQRQGGRRPRPEQHHPAEWTMETLDPADRHRRLSAGSREARRPSRELIPPRAEVVSSGPPSPPAHSHSPRRGETPPVDPDAAVLLKRLLSSKAAGAAKDFLHAVSDGSGGGERKADTPKAMLKKGIEKVAMEMLQQGPDGGGDRRRSSAPSKAVSLAASQALSAVSRAVQRRASADSDRSASRRGSGGALKQGLAQKLLQRGEAALAASGGEHPALGHVGFGTDDALPDEQPAPEAPGPPAQRTVTVEGIPDGCTDDELLAFCDFCGDVLELRLSEPAADGSRHAAVVYTEQWSAELAAMLDGTALCGAALSISAPEPRRRSEPVSGFLGVVDSARRAAQARGLPSLPAPPGAAPPGSTGMLEQAAASAIALGLRRLVERRQEREVPDAPQPPPHPPSAATSPPAAPAAGLPASFEQPLRGAPPPEPRARTLSGIAPAAPSAAAPAASAGPAAPAAGPPPPGAEPALAHTSSAWSLFTCRAPTVDSIEPPPASEPPAEEPSSAHIRTPFKSMSPTVAMSPTERAALGTYKSFESAAECSAGSEATERTGREARSEGQHGEDPHHVSGSTLASLSVSIDPAAALRRPHAAGQSAAAQHPAECSQRSPSERMSSQSALEHSTGTDFVVQPLTLPTPRPPRHLSATAAAVTVAAALGATAAARAGAECSQSSPSSLICSAAETPGPPAAVPRALTVSPPPPPPLALSPRLSPPPQQQQQQQQQVPHVPPARSTPPPDSRPPAALFLPSPIGPTRGPSPEAHERRRAAARRRLSPPRAPPAGGPVPPPPLPAAAPPGRGAAGGWLEPSSDEQDSDHSAAMSEIEQLPAAADSPTAEDAEMSAMVDSARVRHEVLVDQMCRIARQGGAEGNLSPVQQRYAAAALRAQQLQRLPGGSPAPLRPAPGLQSPAAGSPRGPDTPSKRVRFEHGQEPQQQQQGPSPPPARRTPSAAANAPCVPPQRAVPPPPAAPSTPPEPPAAAGMLELEVLRAELPHEEAAVAELRAAGYTHCTPPSAPGRSQRWAHRFALPSRAAAGGVLCCVRRHGSAAGGAVGTAVLQCGAGVTDYAVPLFDPERPASVPVGLLYLRCRSRGSAPPGQCAAQRRAVSTPPSAPAPPRGEELAGVKGQITELRAELRRSEAEQAALRAALEGGLRLLRGGGTAGSGLSDARRRAAAEQLRELTLVQQAVLHKQAAALRQRCALVQCAIPA